MIDENSTGSPEMLKPAAKSVMPAFDRYDAGVLLGFTLYLYVNLFASPVTPYLLDGDQVFFWLDAQRLLHGEQIYQDFFEFNPPGTDLIYLGVFKLFGPRIWTPNLVVLTVAAVLCLLCLRISRSIMSRSQAVLATSLYLVFIIGLTLDGTHHWFSVMAVLGAVLLLMGGKTHARIVVAGALLGIATFITQTRGPVAAVAIATWMLWERSRTAESWASCLRGQLVLFASLLLAWFALSGYYIATVGLKRLWFFQVTYLLRYVVSGWNAASFGLSQGLSLAALSVLARSVFAFVVLPIVYAVSLWRCWKLSRQARSDSTASLCLLTVVGIAMFAEVAGSPSWFRVFCVSLPGVVLLIWLVEGAGKHTAYATRLLWIGVIALAAYQTWSKHRIFSASEELPAGRIAATPVVIEKLGWLAQHTRPGQFMLQAEWPSMYLPVALRNPIYLDTVAESGAVELGYLSLSVRQLEARQVQYIVERPAFSVPAFHTYLVSHYRLVCKFSDLDEIWERTGETRQ